MEHVLEVIEHDDELLVSEVLLQGLTVREMSYLTHPERVGDGLGDQRRVANWSERDEEHTPVQVSGELVRQLDRQARLANSTWARQGEKTSDVQQATGLG